MNFEDALEKFTSMLEKGVDEKMASQLAISMYMTERRERIATAALTGLLTNRSISPEGYETLVQQAVRMADALISELNKNTEI